MYSKKHPVHRWKKLFTPRIKFDACEIKLLRKLILAKKIPMRYVSGLGTTESRYLIIRKYNYSIQAWPFEAFPHINRLVENTYRVALFQKVHPIA